MSNYLVNKGYNFINSKNMDYGWKTDYYENDGVKIEISSCGNDFQIQITIKFEDSEQMSIFRNNLISSGWKQWRKSKDSNYYYTKGYIRDDFEISLIGNEVIIDYYPI